ncbi:unnamed protein product [Macrosiphum euphorbiae]|uniref:Calponin-homology (CH) domain-containing protein n=1 Tax=Macrosiphum euphorbiae TaxID=13131 RepID=A0AAV0X644_9HEMI|nr:unnamed protein product [Macrosiphum euphorbiae]
MSYYKDRLGFDPDEPTANGDGTATTGTPRKSKRGYEENLSKFKDERDAIQKKTFTKWVNKHLKKANRHVGDLFIDLQDGLNLISLLEVLSGDQLPRERGKLRFHMLQNVQMALEYLRFKKIKLVNIRAEEYCRWAIQNSRWVSYGPLYFISRLVSLTFIAGYGYLCSERHIITKINCYTTLVTCDRTKHRAHLKTACGRL